jgi:hypothetical protein
VRAPEPQPDRYSPERLAETPRRQPPAGAPTPGRRATDRPAAARTPAPSLPEGHPSAPVPGHPSAAAAAPAQGRPAVPARSSASASASASAPTAAPAPGRPPVPAAAPEPAASGAAPWSTAPTGLRADRPRPASAALAAGLRAPVQPGTHPSGPIYGDWTKPSRSGVDDDRAVPPATTAIPERDTGRRGAAELDDDYDEFDDYDDDRYEDDDRYAEDDTYDDEDDAYDDDVDEPAPARSTAPPSLDTGPSTMVRGGRAKDREARQIVDEKRRKELKAQGETMTAKAYLADDLDEKRGPRRKIIALVAVAVVALGVLGVYSFVSPDTQQASSGKPATSSSAAAPASGIADATLPELSISAPPVVADPPADVKAPVTVLNETDVNGLAGSIAGQLQAAGWETPATAAYPGSDISVTTVYYTDGDTTQQQAAQALVNAFPQIHGPAPRFFDVPGQPDPGLVVVAAGDWKP